MRSWILTAAACVAWVGLARAQAPAVSPGTLTVTRVAPKPVPSVPPRPMPPTDVVVDRLVEGKKTPLVVPKRLRLQIGDRILVPAGAAVEVIHYASGKRYSLGPGSALVTALKVALETKPPREAKVLSKSPERGLAVSAAAVGTARKVLGVVGRGTLDALLAPAPFGAIPQPEVSDIVLTWKNQGAGSLLVTLTRDGERDPFLAEEIDAGETSFRITTDRIEPGVLYHWKVQDIAQPSRVISAPLWLITTEEKRVRRLLEAEAGALRAQEREVEATMALAEGYLNLGLFTEALPLWRSLLLDEPDNKDYAAQVQRLMRILYLTE